MTGRVLEIEIGGRIERVDLDEIDALWARIQEGPGEDAGERLFAAFANHPNCAIEEARAFIADDAGVPGPETAEPGPAPRDDASGEVEEEPLP